MTELENQNKQLMDFIIKWSLAEESPVERMASGGPIALMEWSRKFREEANVLRKRYMR